jgi:hypothetical protein
MRRRGGALDRGWRIGGFGAGVVSVRFVRGAMSSCVMSGGRVGCMLRGVGLVGFVSCLFVVSVLVRCVDEGVVPFFWLLYGDLVWQANMMANGRPVVNNRVYIG